MGKASSHVCPLWLQAVFENAGRERGLLTREDLLLCTSICKAWRFGLLAMLPPRTESYEGLVWTRLDLSLKGFREGLTVHTLVERLACALRNGPREAQTIVTDFLRAHPGAVDPHYAAKDDDDYSNLRTLSEAALEELLKHQPEEVPLELEQFLFEVVIDQAARHSDVGEAHRVYRKRLYKWVRERSRRDRERGPGPRAAASGASKRERERDSDSPLS